MKELIDPQELRELIQAEAEFVFEKMRENIGDAYWQGRLDSLAWANRNLPKLKTEQGVTA